MNTKENQYYKNNEQVMIDVFIKLLEEKEIHKITVKEICDLAHVNRSTFYHHFLDIYDLLDHVALSHSKRITELFQEYGVSQDRRKNLSLIIHYIKENELFYRISFHTSAFEKLAESFSQLIFNHEIKNNSSFTHNVELEYKIRFYQIGLLSTLSYWLDHDCDMSEEELLDLFESFYIFKNQ